MHQFWDRWTWHALPTHRLFGHGFHSKPVPREPSPSSRDAMLPPGVSLWRPGQGRSRHRQLWAGLCLWRGRWAAPERGEEDALYLPRVRKQGLLAGLAICLQLNEVGSRCVQRSGQLSTRAEPVTAWGAESRKITPTPKIPTTSTSCLPHADPLHPRLPVTHGSHLQALLS